MHYTSSFGADRPAGEAARASRAESLRRRDALARLLDSAVAIPGTRIRFGADAVLNVIPGLGLLAAKSVSAYLIWEARRLGAPAPLLARMVGHVALDAALSALPVIGWFGDVFYRANLKNMALLRAFLADDAGAHAPWRRGRPVG
jgi:hypothetical protein